MQVTEQCQILFRARKRTSVLFERISVLRESFCEDYAYIENETKKNIEKTIFYDNVFVYKHVYKFTIVNGKTTKC